MSDEQTKPSTDETTTQEIPEVKPDELRMLKDRARMMGLKFSNNIGLNTLKEMIEEKMAGGNGDEPSNQENPPETPPALNDPSLPAPTKKETLRQRLYRENMRLVRLRITNMDPKKKDLPGEVITVANEYLGTVRKFVPFGEVTEDGYHVPYCIYKQLYAR